MESKCSQLFSSQISCYLSHLKLGQGLVLQKCESGQHPNAILPIVPSKLLKAREKWRYSPWGTQGKLEDIIGPFAMQYQSMEGWQNLLLMIQ